MHARNQSLRLGSRVTIEESWLPLSRCAACFDDESDRVSKLMTQQLLQHHSIGATVVALSAGSRRVDDAARVRAQGLDPGAQVSASFGRDASIDDHYIGLQSGYGTQGGIDSCGLGDYPDVGMRDEFSRNAFTD